MVTWGSKASGAKCCGLERTGIEKRDKFLRWDNSGLLMGFEVKQVCITGDEIVCLCFAGTDQKLIIFPVSTLLCDGCPPLGEQPGRKQCYLSLICRSGE